MSWLDKYYDLDTWLGRQRFVEDKFAIGQEELRRQRERIRRKQQEEKQRQQQQQETSGTEHQSWCQECARDIGENYADEYPDDVAQDLFLCPECRTDIGE